MAHVDAGRNLLYGVLAMQLELIDAQQFAEACAAWTVRKDASLADVLADRGWITQDDRRNLEGLLERKLKRYGGDVRASLAAVADAKARDALRRVEDPDVRNSLSALPPAAGHVLVETLLRPNESRSRYTLTRLHAEGGLGKVWLAHDGDLNREVALKELKPEQADHPDAWRRFLREAQVTGQLEHPNIVPVYELARRVPDDQPFYTMRFVRGRTHRQAIAEYHAARTEGRGDPLEWRKLLQACVGVCQAVGYAHSRGVIHRDLKPENIILGGFGEVLVLDWGLAKAVGQTDPNAEAWPAVGLSEDARLKETQAGAWLGTPAYMAPEQAEGRIDLVDARTDIYGLGTILFELLTGQPPHAGSDTRALLPRIAAGPTPRARNLDRSVPPALDAICARAMAKARGERYANALDLARDLERWLADEPVSAWREPWTKRAQRWAKRHRTAVTATLAAGAVAVVLGGMGLIAYQRQVRQEEMALRAALARAEQSRTAAWAAWSERLDSAGWARAEDATAAIAPMVKPRLPGRLRRQVHALVEHISAQARAARDDQDLLAQLTAIRAAAGDPQYNATEEYRRAFGLDRSGHSLRGQRQDPADRPRAVAIELASFLDHWALLLGSGVQDQSIRGRIVSWAHDLDTDPWRDELREALSPGKSQERRHQMLLRLAQSGGVVSQPAVTLTLLGSGLTAVGDADAAIQLLEPARFRHSDPWVYQELGQALRAARPPRREDALRAFAAATALRPAMGFELAIGLRDAGRTAEGIEVLQAVLRHHPDAWSEYMLGKMQRDLGRAAEASASFQRAVALSRASIARSGGDASAYADLGAALLESGDTAGAIAAFRQGIRLDPKDETAHYNLGNAHYASGDMASAIAAFRQAIRLKPNYALAHMNLGVALRASGDAAGAIAADREAIRLEPDSATAHSNLGIALQDSGDVAGAVVAHRAAIRLKPDSAEAHNNLGAALSTLGDMTGAIAAYREGIRLKPDQAVAHYNLGNALSASGDVQGTIAAYRQAIRLRPEYPEAHCNLGFALQLLGRYEEAATELALGHELGSRQPGWKYPSAAWVEEARRLARLEPKLEAVWTGRARPASPQEAADLAKVASAKGRYAAAACLGAEAFTADPTLANDLGSERRYNAACAAALAGCGRGQDDPPPNPEARAALRRQAREWLRADLDAWTKVPQDGPPALRQAVLPMLQHWKSDPDLAGLREVAELAQWPEAERDACRRLWADVDALLAREAAEAQRAQPPATELPSNPFVR